MEDVIVFVLSYVRDWWGPLLIGIGIIFRNSITNFLADKISQRSIKKIEELKSDLRVSENLKRDLDKHIADSFENHSNLLCSKKMQAAEDLIKARQFLAQFHILTLYMQILDIPKILEMREKKIVDLFATLMKPFEGELEALKVDKTRPLLYLNERTLKAFEIYELMITNAYTMLTLISFDIKNKHKFIKNDSKLTQLIIEYVPNSEEGFNKFGANYAYYWATYFYEEIMNTTRKEILDLGNVEKKIGRTSEITYRSYAAAEELMKNKEAFKDLPLNPIFKDERAKNSSLKQ